MDSRKGFPAHALPEAERILSFVGEIIAAPEGETGLKKRNPAAVPFPEFVGEQTFQRIPFQRTDRLFLVAKQPKILIGIEIVVPYFQRQVVGNRGVFYFKREIVFLIFLPRRILDGLVLVVQSRRVAGEKQEADPNGKQAFTIPTEDSADPPAGPVWQIFEVGHSVACLDSFAYRLPGSGRY